jgi:hypothetical protein
MSRVNGATDALNIGPSPGYSLFLIFVHVILLFTATLSSYYTTGLAFFAGKHFISKGFFAGYFFRLCLVSKRLRIKKNQKQQNIFKFRGGTTPQPFRITTSNMHTRCLM